MKVSALGVEEQRLNVIIDFAEGGASTGSAKAIVSKSASSSGASPLCWRCQSEVLERLGGWTCDELAAKLDIPRGTVMSRPFNARRKLMIMTSARFVRPCIQSHIYHSVL